MIQKVKTITNKLIPNIYRNCTTWHVITCDCTGYTEQNLVIKRIFRLTEQLLA